MHYDPPSDVDARAFAAQLNRRFPPNNEVSWLRLVWEPGDFWQPVHRWFLYQMVPWRKVNRMHREWLLGPNPRLAGHYDFTLRRFISRAPPVSLRQWLLFHETVAEGHAALGVPWWVIEGERGGYRYRLDPVEKRALAVHGVDPPDTPTPGTLAYAAPDHRVMLKVADLDKLQAWKAMVDYADRGEEVLSREERDTAEALQWDIYKWLESQVVEDALDSIRDASGRSAWGRLRSDAPRSEEPNYEAALQSFIEEGWLG